MCTTTTIVVGKGGFSVGAVDNVAHVPTFV